MSIVREFKVFKIKRICKKYNIRWYSINDDCSVNANFIELTKKKLTKIPIKFNRIDDGFYCYDNLLTNLKNSPIYVGRQFNCMNNKLTTLLGGPKYVGGDYHCANNNLRDVYGFPETYQGYFQAMYNPVCVILNLVPENKQLNFVKILNEYKVIRNGDSIIESRLKDAAYEVGVNLSQFEFKDYKLI